MQQYTKFHQKRLHVHCLQYGFVMYNDNLILSKIEVVPPIPNYMTTVYFCQQNSSIFTFTKDDIKSSFELLSKNKMNDLYLT